MASYNKVLLMGNLTKDPELRYTPQGVAVANLRLAVNRKFRGKDQQMKEEVCYITVVVWNKQAETCNQYLHKGSSVFIEGMLQSRSWEDNAGQKRNVVEVKADRVQFMGKAPARGAEDPGQDSAPGIAEPSTESAWLQDNEEAMNES